LYNKTHTIDSIQVKLVHQRPRAAGKIFHGRRATSHLGKVFTSFSAASNGQDDFHLWILSFQLSKGAKAAFGAVDGHLRVGPFIAELILA
jgi:hypothetical protein